MATPNRKQQVTKQEMKVKPEAKASEVVLEAPAMPEVEQNDLISLEEYIERNKPHKGLVASFVYEAKQTEKGLSERSEVDWEADFGAQSKRVYKAFQ